MRKISAVLPCLLAAALFLAAQPPACPSCKDFSPPPACSPARKANPLEELQNGNDRYKNKRQHPRQSPACAQALACCQKPFAIVLSCADSRIPPELIFDQGLGDLFVVRVAGNVTTPGVLGSIEYAVDVLNTKVIVVLGHQRCGAVKAAFGERPGPHLNAIWDLIRPAIPAPPPNPIPDDIWDRAVRVNVANMVKNLRKDLQVADRSNLIIKEAYFSLDTGALSPRIWQ